MTQKTELERSGGEQLLRWASKIKKNVNRLPVCPYMYMKTDACANQNTADYKGTCTVHVRFVLLIALNCTHFVLWSLFTFEWSETFKLHDYCTNIKMMVERKSLRKKGLSVPTFCLYKYPLLQEWASLIGLQCAVVALQCPDTSDLCKHTSSYIGSVWAGNKGAINDNKKNCLAITCTCTCTLYLKCNSNFISYQLFHEVVN